MIRIIKKILIISNSEDYKNIGFILPICFLILTLIINEDSSLYGSVMVCAIGFMFVSLLTYQIGTLHERKQFDFILYESCISKNKLSHIFYIIGVIQGFPIFLIMLFMLLINRNDTNLLNLLLSFSLTYILSVLLGMMWAKIFKNTIIGYVPIFLYYLFIVNQIWPLAELLRFVSPGIILFYSNSIQWNYYLLMLGLLLILYSIGDLFESNFKTKISKILLFFGMCILITTYIIEHKENRMLENKSYEIIHIDDYEIKSKGINGKDVKLLSSIISKINDSLYYFGINEYKHINIVKYHVFLFGNEARIPVMIDDNIIQINIISNAMLNLQNEDILYEIMNRIYDKLNNKFMYQCEKVKCIKIYDYIKNTIFLESFGEESINNNLINDINQEILNREYLIENYGSDLEKQLLTILKEKPMGLYKVINIINQYEN